MPDTSARKTQRSICVIAEDLSLPVDEGIKHFAISLVQGWSQEHRVLGLSVRSLGQITTPNTASLRTNKFFLSYRLFSRLRRFKPEIICYVPSASATIFSLLRARMLKVYCPGARVVMVSLQPRHYGRVSRHLIPLFSPDMIYVQHEHAMRQLLTLGCKTKMLTSGVDLRKFAPVSPDRKGELRTKYGLDPKAFTVLHVGHITRERNIELLIDIHREHAAQVVLVGSSLIHDDRAEISSRLKEQGIVILDKYFENIEELYQLSDCYIFPVVSDQSCIGIPLSVLEAMACNVPVAAIRYGLLPSLFHEEQGIFFAEAPEGLIQCVTRARSLNGSCHTREDVAAYSWEKVAADILEKTGTCEEIHP
jgi:glycosyltransferase involved in cell wall biosynthesis